MVPAGNAAHSPATTAARRARTTRAEQWAARIAPFAAIAVLIALWQILAESGAFRTFVLPFPLAVWQELVSRSLDGTLITNAGATLQEAGEGFALAALIALPLGYLLAHIPLLERFLSPLIAASQAIPAVAVAPLLLLWLGNGLLPKVVVCTVIVFFPLVITTLVGVRGVAREYLEVARVFGVPLWEQIFRVELPLAAPVLLGGAKLGLTLSLTGAIVGEFVASNQGLGYLLTFSEENLDTPLLFATLVVLGGTGVLLYWCISVLERIVARWQG